MSWRGVGLRGGPGHRPVSTSALVFFPARVHLRGMRTLLVDLDSQANTT
jgi:hypothetical protein